MPKKSQLQSAAPFKAKLRHYHRSVSPALYDRKQKRWEDVSLSELGDATISESQGNIDLAVRLAQLKKATSRKNPSRKTNIIPFEYPSTYCLSDEEFTQYAASSPMPYQRTSVAVRHFVIIL